ncbi:CLUMA_CG011140, isoform A [Clunio marinus]|uniref:CLUMA_CG011140, isoform A n=1 Tax=Clunio marinus TaxID=568069 RepID=A0A1J1IC01_9DIPT|nr:CLUMA_CG011140, isoform A [Clunio marinus]
MESCHLKQCLSGVLIVIAALISDNGVQPDVNFKSKPTTIKTFENDSVLLPCYSTERHTAVRWLSQDNKLIADSRYPNYKIPNRVLHSNGSLEVNNIQLDDTGDYLCEVTIGTRLHRQTNSIEVQVEPDVITFPAGTMNVTIGAIFQITCEPKGVPYPIISWYHNGKHVTNTYDGDRRLTVEVKHYDMAGRIECVANNGVGKEPKAAGILLVVNFAPEIKTSMPVVHTRPGLQAKIDCLVVSHPVAQIHWFFNGTPVNKRNNLITTQDTDLTASEPYPMYYSKKRHILMIRNVRETDLGKYECIAENSLGMQSGSIMLTGTPLKPSFENKSHPATISSKMLSWQTESLSPIIDYKFKFRRVPTGNENFRKSENFIWNQLTIPADRTTGPFHTKSYKLEALAPATVYEVMIQARNQFGSSDDSKILRFATPSETETINSSSTEANEYDIRYDEDLLSNEIFTSPYNAGDSLTSINILFLFIKNNYKFFHSQKSTKKSFLPFRDYTQYVQTLNIFSNPNLS